MSLRVLGWALSPKSGMYHLMIDSERRGGCVTACGTGVEMDKTKMLGKKSPGKNSRTCYKCFRMQRKFGKKASGPEVVP